MNLIAKNDILDKENRRIFISGDSYKIIAKSGDIYVLNHIIHDGSTYETFDEEFIKTNFEIKN